MYKTIAFLASMMAVGFCSAQSPTHPTVTTTKKGDATSVRNANGVIVIRCVSSQAVCCVIISGGITTNGGGPGTVTVAQKTYDFSTWTSEMSTTNPKEEVLTFKDAVQK